MTEVVFSALTLSVGCQEGHQVRASCRQNPHCNNPKGFSRKTCPEPGLITGDMTKADVCFTYD